METIEVSCVLPTKAAQVYKDWLSNDGHSEMTGGAAEAIAEVGSKHTAWDGYIWGVQLELSPNTYIKQTWRSTQFEDQHKDSVLEVHLEDTEEGCKVKLIHSDIPEGQGSSYASGWQEHYFDPMLNYYQS